MCVYSQDKSAQSGPQDGPVTFRSGVFLVTVPVVVRDGEGRAVGTLAKEDFELFDKGKPQEISRFSIEKGAAGEALETAAPSTQIAESKTAAGPPPASRFVAYLFDDLHLSFAEVVRARDAAIQYLPEALQPGDRAAVFTTSGNDTLEFTADREKLRHAIEHITPQSKIKHGAAECPDVSEYMADLIIAREDRDAYQLLFEDAKICDIKVTRLVLEAKARFVSEMADGETRSSLEVLKNVVQRMSSLPGQREVVVVSAGFFVTTHRDLEMDVIEQAIRARVRVNTLDARGLYTIVPGGDASKPGGLNLGTAGRRIRYQGDEARTRGEVLGDFANGTGGTLFHNSNDLLEGFRRTAQWPEFTYILGFAPRDLKFDGSFHSLKATVKMPGVTLEVRQGYRAPKHANDLSEDSPDEISQVLFSRKVEMGLTAELEAKFMKAGENSARLSVLAHVDLQRTVFKKDGGLNRTALTVAAAVFDPDGTLVGTLEKQFTLRLTDERLAAARDRGIALPPLNIDVPRGSYTIRLVVRDTEGHTAARNGAVEIQ